MIHKLIWILLEAKLKCQIDKKRIKQASASEVSVPLQSRHFEEALKSQRLQVLHQEITRIVMHKLVLLILT